MKENSKNSKFFEKDFRVTKNRKTERADSKEIIENDWKDLSKLIGSPPAYFKLNRKEMAQALHVLDSQSSEINDYNLSYTYDDDLNELPEEPSDLNAYADILISHSRLEMEKSESERNWLQISQGLGMAGSLRKMTGKFEDAESLLGYSLNIITLKRLPLTSYVQQSIRLCDVWKRSGSNEKAIRGLSKIIDLCAKDESLHYYLDVAIQHLGKVQYSTGNIETALQFFQKALDLRIKKKDQDLIDSSQTAIETCRLKLAQRK